MRYREQSAGAGLDRWVECIWWIEAGAAITGHAVRPDGCIDILYSAEGGLQVVGAMTSEQRFDLPAGARTLGVRFRPGMAAAFLKTPAAELTDLVVPLEEFWGARAKELASQVAEAQSPGEILIGALRVPEESPNGVQRAIEMLTASHGEADLVCVAHQAGMSERQFRRRCLDESGLGPKQLSKVLRFRRACALGQGGLPWGLVAVEAGYFDQAHLIRDFREFTGSTPVSVLSNTDEGHSG
jgi:AraC-like DNA-binding protein